MNFDILVVSQFTLHANLNKGLKPDFHDAMGTEPAKIAFGECVEMFKSLYKPERIQTGRFGEMMKVSIDNDGPVTFVLE
jgi:D-tyrosyl-tRNA(Tyr) deacylase